MDFGENSRLKVPKCYSLDRANREFDPLQNKLKIR